MLLRCTAARMHRRKETKTKTKKNKIKVSKSRTHRRTDAYKEVLQITTVLHQCNTTATYHTTSCSYKIYYCKGTCSITQLPIPVTNYYT